MPEAEPRLHLALKSPVDLGHDRLDLAPAERADGAATGAASVETRLAALQHMHPAAAAETCVHTRAGEGHTEVCTTSDSSIAETLCFRNSSFGD